MVAMTRSKLLVIGPAELQRAIAQSVPTCEVIAAEHALDGLWRSGHEEFHGAFVSLGLGSSALPAIRSLRQISPELRIVVSCEPTEEPAARRAVEHGADEYLLEPVQRGDLERAFDLVPTEEDYGPPPARGLVERELEQVAGLLGRLQEGPQTLLDALCAQLQEVFGVRGVQIQFGEHASRSGQVDAVVLEEPIVRDGHTVGRIGLAAPEHGPLTASAASRLTEYASLADQLLTQADALEHWRDLAWTDDLSGLRNRRYFQQRFEALLADATERRLQLTLFAFDIDNFKSYNDAYGHEAGDNLIREIARMLRHATREQDVICRFGGDEFAVIFWESEKPRVPGSKHPNAPMALIQRFQKTIEEHAFDFLGADRPGPVTISGGLATFPWDGTSPEQLLRAADHALMTAKRTGKNSVGLAGEPQEGPRALDDEDSGPAESADR